MIRKMPRLEEGLELPNFEALIDNHEGWLTDRVVKYAQEKSYTEYSSTLREAWRISICRLSEPLVDAINAAQSSQRSREDAIENAKQLGVEQGLNHRSIGVDLTSFVGLLKLYRDAYLDLVIEKEELSDPRLRLQKLIVELFDAIEIGILTAWEMSTETEKLSELQKRNRELSNEKNKYLTVFESIAEPAILLNTADEPTHVNAAAYRLLLGETTPGAGYYGDLKSSSLQAAIVKILKSCQCNASTPAPIKLDTPGGTRTFGVAIQQMLDISKKFAGRVIILQEVTDYLEAIDAAQAADRAKSVFLTTISHEIRTPINSILGLTRLLDDGTFPPEKLRRLRNIRASGEVLSTLIENVLGLSRAETGALQRIERDFNLGELCDALFQVLELEEYDQRLRLEKRIESDVPLQLHGDAHKLRHILMNLLSNALKFTETGTVQLSVSLAAVQPDDALTIQFNVVDTGPGLDEGEIDKLFEPFHQSTQTGGSRVPGGSGLGLAISKQFVEFLGGRIEYKPNPEGGSVFSFSLGFKSANRASSLQEIPTGHNVLVVEDDPVNAIVIEGYLKELGNTVTVAGTYESAVAALENHNFNIVVTDYRLPQKSGIDVAKKVRQIGVRKNVKIPVIVVTAAMPDEAPEALRRADVSLFLEKPFSRYELATALSSVSLNVPTDDIVEDIEDHVATNDLNRLLSDLGFARCQAVVQSYQSNTPSIVSGMEARLAAGDLAGLSELAHQLISASGFVGAWKVVELSKKLKDVSNSEDEQKAPDTFAMLASECERTRKALEEWWSRIESTHSH